MSKLKVFIEPCIEASWGGGIKASPFSVRDTCVFVLRRPESLEAKLAGERLEYGNVERKAVLKVSGAADGGWYVICPRENGRDDRPSNDVLPVVSIPGLATK